MKISEIFQALDKISPFKNQENWDNSGLQVGNFSDDISNIVLSLDLDNKVIEESETNSLIITHHPLIFGKLKQLDFSKYPANIIQSLMKKNLKLISLHTNFDKAILNKYVLETVLKFNTFEQIDDFVLIAKVDMQIDDFIHHIQKSFNLPFVKSTNLPQKISKIALTTGSGASLLNLVNSQADVFLTGDIKYHDAMESQSLNLGLIDIGHFESEIFFAESLKPHLEFLNIPIQIINSDNPFLYQV